MSVKRKIECFDGVRTASCLLVVGFHAYLTMLGHLGLSSFFILSGFLSYYNYYDRPGADSLSLIHCARFSLKKIAKLYPLHLAMLLVMLVGQLYGYAHGLISRFALVRKLIFNAALLQSWVPVNEVYFSFNVPSWYLSTMMFLYFAFPVVLRLMRRYRTRAAAVLAIGAVLAVQLISAYVAVTLYDAHAVRESYETPAFAQWFTQVLPLYRLGDFIVGCNLAYLFTMRGEREASRAYCVALELVGVALTAVAHSLYLSPSLPVWLGPTELFLLPAAVFVYAFALGNGLLARLGTTRPVKFIAGLSSDIYLTHFVVITFASIICSSLPIPAAWQKAAFVCFVACVTLGASMLCARIRRRRKLLMRGITSKN